MDSTGRLRALFVFVRLVLRYSLVAFTKGKTMITEIAQIEIKPGSEKDFEDAIAKAQPIFKRCKGWKSFELHRSIEKPQRYRLHIKWETLENHTVDFRGSENFAEWRALVGPHFAAPPEVEHTDTVVSY